MCVCALHFQNAQSCTYITYIGLHVLYSTPVYDVVEAHGKYAMICSHQCILCSLTRNGFWFHFHVAIYWLLSLLKFPLYVHLQAYVASNSNVHVGELIVSNEQWAMSFYDIILMFMHAHTHVVSYLPIGHTNHTPQRIYKHSCATFPLNTKQQWTCTQYYASHVTLSTS